MATGIVTNYLPLHHPPQREGMPLPGQPTRPRRAGRGGSLFALAVFATLALVSGPGQASLLAAPAISYVQGNYATPQSSQTSVTVPFTAAQASGDLNVIVVGWNDSTAAVKSVTDKRGNTYTLATGPTKVSGLLSQSIYYAKNIAPAAAGANSVTVTFSTAAAYPDIRIAEYSGADTSRPLDVTAADSGSGTTSASGAAATTNATDLIFAANMVRTSTSGAGSGFAQRLLTSPDSDLVEDRQVTSTGSYSASAPMGSSGAWIMQMVAFRTPAGAPPPSTPAKLAAAPASSSQISLSWSASTSSVGIANYILERCQNAGCTNFDPIATPSATSYTDTGLSSNMSYSYRVQAVDTAGNASQYSNVVSATTPAVAASTITYVQGNYATPQSPEASVTVPFTAAQRSGDLNVVIVGWNDSTAAVKSVTDKSGNSYTLATGPTKVGGALSQSIYYARSIRAAAAGANSVTVSFSTAAVYPDIRVLEYAGADPANPVDVTAASSGSSTTSASAAATTTNPTDLILGANIVRTSTTGAGSSFTRRMITSPDGDLAEDRMTTAAGSYRATAPLGSSGAWIMQMVAFRTSSAGSGSGAGNMGANPATLSFGNINVGSSSSRAVTLSNSGTASVTIAQVSLTGAGFSISGLALPLTLAAGATTSFTVTFAPKAAGSVTGSASVASTAANSPVAIALSGMGDLEALSVNPGSLSFGDVVLGGNSILPVIATNTGNTSITISQAAASGAGFSVSGPALPFTLAAGKNTSFSVTFAPAAAGDVTGNLSIVSNATGSPTVASLSATGVDQHSVTLSWGASPSPNITGYNVYRATVSGGPYTKLDSSLVTTTNFTDTTPDAGETYYYVTTAVDSQGVESADSNQATAAVPTP